MTAKPSWLNAELLFWLGACIIIFSGLGLRDPWPADEPRFALIARDMVDSGQWLFPLRGGELYPDKPPLFMWAIALCYLAVGNLKIAFLLPSALSALLTLAAMRWLLNHAGGHANAGALSLLAMTQFVVQAKTAQIDAMLAGLTTCSLCLLLYHLTIAPRWSFAYIAGIFAGLGVITKGVGFLPLLVLLPYFIFKKRNKAWVQHDFLDWRWLGVLFAFLGAIMLWLLPMVWAVEKANSAELLAYRDNILFHQTANRYLDAWHHLKPWHYYLSHVIIWAWFPLIVALPFLAAAIKQHWRQLHGGVALLLFWSLLVLIFFSFSAGKRGVYLLPITPALAMVFGLVYQYLPGQKFDLWAWRLLLALSLIVALVCSVVRFRVVEMPSFDGEKIDISLFLDALLVVCGIMLFLFLTMRDRLSGAIAVVIWVGGLWCALGFFAFPALNPLRTSAALMTEVESMLPPGHEFAMIDWKEQYSLFSSRPIIHFGYAQPLQNQLQAAREWERSSPRTRWLMVPEDHLNECESHNAKYLGTRHRTSWRLVDRC